LHRARGSCEKIPYGRDIDDSGVILPVAATDGTPRSRPSAAAIAEKGIRHISSRSDRSRGEDAVLQLVQGRARQEEGAGDRGKTFFLICSAVQRLPEDSLRSHAQIGASIREEAWVVQLVCDVRQ
jgi:hypothetical protein